MKANHRILGGGVLRIVPFAVLSLTGACGGAPTQPTSPPRPGTASPVVVSYLREVIDVMETHAVNRESIEWTAVRADVIAAAGAAQTVPDSYGAISRALALLGDNFHSRYTASDGTVLTGGLYPCSNPSVATPPDLPADVGYLRVPACAVGGAEGEAFATDLQAQTRARDSHRLLGWIVDLRGNFGGNMWPMLVGVGPILGEGRSGFFITADDVENPWGYSNGASWLNDEIGTAVATPYRLIAEHPRVAVLTDGATTSAGEAIVLAFKARPDTRFFGSPTCGQATAIQGYRLSDGASLGLAVAFMADRTKALYPGRVSPDEIVLDSTEAVSRAAHWVTGGDAAARN